MQSGLQILGLEVGGWLCVLGGQEGLKGQTMIGRDAVLMEEGTHTSGKFDDKPLPCRCAWDMGQSKAAQW